MLIDWFTVGAQIVNFLVLMVLLKIFLFDRIVQAMDDREANINGRFADAERQKEQAGQEAQTLKGKQRELEEKREQLFEEAKADAEAQREQWADQARREIDRQRAQWQKALGDQKETFNRDLRHLAAEQVYAVSRRALKDLADEALEERIIEGFLSRVAAMDRDAKKKFNRSQPEQNGHATVHSAFEVSTRMRQKVTRVLHQELAEDLQIDYQTDGGLLAGIELKAAGQKISWSLGDYLQTLEENVIKALEEQAYKGKKSDQDEKRQTDNGEPGDSSRNEQRSD